MAIHPVTVLGSTLQASPNSGLEVIRDYLNGKTPYMSPCYNFLFIWWSEVYVNLSIKIYFQDLNETLSKIWDALSHGLGFNEPRIVKIDLSHTLNLIIFWWELVCSYKTCDALCDSYTFEASSNPLGTLASYQCSKLWKLQNPVFWKKCKLLPNHSTMAF